MNPVTIPQNPIQFEGICNFRDLGGLKKRQGETVRHGMIFRSDELSRLTDTDVSHLTKLPLRTIVDLRTDWEISRWPDRHPATIRNAVVCTLDTPRCLISIGNLYDDKSIERLDPAVRDMLGDTDAKLGTLPEEQIREAVIKLYEMMIEEADFIEAYRRIFSMLLQDENMPLLFHCMAGKDRTGVLAALIYSALDIDEEAIVEDYLVSNVVAGRKYAKQIAMNPSLRYLYRAYPEYISAFLGKIRGKCGTAEHYLRETLNVDTDEMKKLYLE